ncbi:lipopolysaccharide biosynthesis protein [Clostridium perfringens]|nr:sugar isomerase [Clostridium perfringens]EIF6169245.1 sugar isomerase [Clostridium perfringens]MDU1810047.1 sugar isomerase [Clostridium perfringens]
MRKKLFMWNTITSLLSKFVAIICAFILPRLILQTYGTEVNGLVSSISQFLTVIALTEFGVTAVVQSALYKPLAENDFDNISKIMASSSRFFRRIAYILICYIILLCILYPFLINSVFGFWYTAGLILAMSINSLVQYLFGITKSQLIAANQRLYIISMTEIIVNILNTIICCILIYEGASIQIVKITTALIFIIQPITYTLYVRKNYKINYNIKYEEEPIKQKWNGLAQHIAYYVLNATDTIVLTLFSTLDNVSIYCIYKLVLAGIHQLFSIFENAVKPFLGEIWALKESTQLKKYFNLYEWFINTLVCFIFGCTLTLIVPFVKVYTKGINDANYIVPGFAIIFTLSYAMQNIRNPYNVLIMSVGHYKQTQKNYIITTIINIIISIILVYKLGLIGVAIGTLIALSYQTFWQAWYIYTHVLQCKMTNFIKQIIIDALTLIIGSIFVKKIILKNITYLGFIVMGLKVSAIWSIIIIIINLIFFKNNIINIFKLIINKKN